MMRRRSRLHIGLVALLVALAACDSTEGVDTTAVEEIPSTTQAAQISTSTTISESTTTISESTTTTSESTTTTSESTTTVAGITGEPVFPDDSPFIDGTSDHLPQVVNVNYGIDFTDVDGDGNIDMWVADCGRIGDQLLRNDGRGIFSDVTTTSLSRPDAVDQWARTSFGEDVVFADIDGDGDMDSYVNSSPHDPDGDTWAEALFINDGTGQFTDEIVSRMPTDVFGQQGISGLAVFGDVDGDGDVDLVRSTRFHRTTLPGQNGRTGLFLNDGSGHFVDATARLPDDSGTHTSGLGLADVDLDGSLDIVQATAPVDTNPDSANELRVYLNDGDGRFSDASDDLLPPAWREGLNTAKFDLGDVDSDGDVDIVSSNVILRYDQPSGTFLADHTTPVIDGAGLAIVGDVNGDGHLDIVATKYREIEGHGTNHPMLLLNDQSGGFGRPQPIAEMPPMTIIQEMGLADVDGDGDLDLYVGTGVPPHGHPGQEGMVGGTQLDRLFVNTFEHEA